jgi:hypothetical protein
VNAEPDERGLNTCDRRFKEFPPKARTGTTTPKFVCSGTFMIVDASRVRLLDNLEVRLRMLVSVLRVYSLVADQSFPSVVESISRLTVSSWTLKVGPRHWRDGSREMLRVPKRTKSSPTRTLPRPQRVFLMTKPLAPHYEKPAPWKSRDSHVPNWYSSSKASRGSQAAGKVMLYLTTNSRSSLCYDIYGN